MSSDDVEAESSGTPAESTGTERAAQIHSAADTLTDLDAAELSAHVEVYQQLHSELQSALSEIDDA